MNEYQRRKALEILDNIRQYHISNMFSQPVDPIRDNCPTYFEKIKYPMDLSTVKKKLLSNEYINVNQWKSDMERIWENTVLFNGKTSFITALAKHLQNIFRKLTENFTGNDATDWATICEELKSEVNRISKLGPKPKNSPTERKLNPPRIKRQTSVISKDYVSPPPPSPPPKISQPPTIQKVNNKIQTRKNDIDTNKLVSDVNTLQNPHHVQMVIDLIKEYEPGLIEGEDAELAIDILKDTTLEALRKLLDELLY